MNEEITPLLPIVIGERYSQTISNLRHAALLRRRELTLYLDRSAKPTQEALKLIQYSEVVTGVVVAFSQRYR